MTYESGFVTTLGAKLAPADTTMTVAVAPTVTAGRLYLNNGAQEERIDFTGVSSLTLTGLTRGLSQTADPATAGTGLTWLAGTVVVITAMHDQLLDKLAGDEAIIAAKIYATTAARDSALGADGVATKNYTGIYVTATGLHYNYNLSSGAWESVDTGTTTANTSTTVAGKAETSTAAEMTAGTTTGGTGANLFVTPDVIQASIQSGEAVYGADAGGDDTYVVALTPTLSAYTTGQVLIAKVATANTGACTIDFGPGVKNIKTRAGNDPQDGAVVAGTNMFEYDGTNMVLLHEDAGSKTNKGTFEMLTDAEAVTGTDETRVPNIKQTVDKFGVADIVQLTAVGNVGGAVNYSHGLGRLPRHIIFHAISSSSDGGTYICSHGFYDGTSNACTYIGEDNGSAVNGNDASNCIRIEPELGSTGDDDTHLASVTATSTTNFTLTWVVTDGDAGQTTYVTALVF